MQISFIGSPCSGKTTLAVKLFAHLKQAEVPCELLTEVARMYVARERYYGCTQLTDHDMFCIMQDQLLWERIMRAGVSEEGILVTDSSPLNSLFYMSAEGQAEAKNFGLVTEANRTADLVFYCPPTGGSHLNEPNRIHDVKASEDVNGKIMPVLAAFAPNVLNDMIRLEGPLAARFAALVATVDMAR